MFYEYDAEGRLIRKSGQDTETSGTELPETYEYDAAGNMIKQTVWNEDGTMEGWREFTYDEEGRQTQQKNFRRCRSSPGNTSTMPRAVSPTKSRKRPAEAPQRITPTSMTPREACGRRRTKPTISHMNIFRCRSTFRGDEAGHGAVGTVLPF